MGKLFLDLRFFKIYLGVVRTRGTPVREHHDDEQGDETERTRHAREHDLGGPPSQAPTRAQPSHEPARADEDLVAREFALVGAHGSSSGRGLDLRIRQIRVVAQGRVEPKRVAEPVLGKGLRVDPVLGVRASRRIPRRASSLVSRNLCRTIMLCASPARPWHMEQ